MTDVHGSAREGYAREAKTYAHGRPDYPDELLGWLGEALEIGAGKEVVDLGAGTGKFTSLLARSGAQVTAIEPVAAMREQLGEKLPGVKVLNGTAQAMPLVAQSVDALTCAQAFHWFANERALHEIHRVLRPGGHLGLVWNVRDERVDWVAEMARIVERYEGSTPRFHTGLWRQAFSGARFEPLRLREFSYQHVGPPEQVIVARILSVSFIAMLPQEQKQRVAEQLRELIASHPDLKGRDEIAVPYRTEAYSTRTLA
ncbi:MULTISPECIES: class I SAM-dependent methyltransferase [Pseudomonas]|uniref:Class I SAM-dependent methyltransferase n=1 Tax=Pseudomonas multiresinivorans TaxID=95301 RepID=A0A7Z3GNX6_9PSED|nr:class I SAM-dependent methyltransferase [Pseudomonas multiresinivorans]QJP07353.1 class I SAM-dependent methyltransferase [Pseudomonas multiresinivorans]